MSAGTVHVDAPMRYLVRYEALLCCQSCRAEVGHALDRESVERLVQQHRKKERAFGARCRVRVFETITTDYADAPKEQPR